MHGGHELLVFAVSTYLASMQVFNAFSNKEKKTFKNVKRRI